MQVGDVVMFPGQGSQSVGMGAGLWERFPDWVRLADEILGYSVRELCEEPGGTRLNQTAFTQPALFVVNALSYRAYREEHPAPAVFVGHSLGELNALHAAGAFDFGRGLELVAKRAELMSRAPRGAMAVVIGLPLVDLRALLLLDGIDGVDIANHNAERQVVLSGAPEALQRSRSNIVARGGQFIPLNVSGAFHSTLMRAAAREFYEFLRGHTFGRLQTPVISNYTATAYVEDRIAELLTLQLAHPVRWFDTMVALQAKGYACIEVGPKRVLSNLLREFVSTPDAAKALGSAAFTERYRVRHPLVAGSMYRGIASVDLVSAMARAGFLSFFGAGGLGLDEVARALETLGSSLGPDPMFGCNVLFQDDAEYEERLVDLLLRYRVRVIEASAYIRPTPALIRYKAAGLVLGSDARTTRIIVKLARADVAEAFLQPPPADMLEELVRSGAISSAAAQRLACLPVADDVTVEADSAGHTAKGHLSTLLPAILEVRRRLQAQGSEAERVHVGAGGGIGDPRAAMAAFLLGADYVVTGSINQCTVEAGTSDAVKDILQTLDVNDTAYAPAGDLFELGAEVQVVKKGTFFPARGRKLYDLFVHHRQLDDIDGETRQLIERKYFGRNIDEVWQEVQSYQSKRSGTSPVHAEPKAKMAAVFKWYFHQTTLKALRGDTQDKINFQIHCGPAMGAFNRWVRGTQLEAWRNRRVADVSLHLLQETRRLYAAMAS